MSGEELKNKLQSTGYNLTEVARLLGKPQQNFSQTLNNTSDVKSGMIEELCEKLKVNISFFYEGTKYLLNTTNNEYNKEVLDKAVPFYMYKAMLDERDQWRDKSRDYENEIETLINKLVNYEPSIREKRVV